MITPNDCQVSITLPAQSECVRMLTALGMIDEVKIDNLKKQMMVTFANPETADAFLDLFTE